MATDSTHDVAGVVPRVRNPTASRGAAQRLRGFAVVVCVRCAHYVHR